MNDFDELLNEVLRQDANPQPPVDMKKRLIDGLSIDAALPRSSSGRRLWVGIAAAILVGLTTWSLARIKPWVPAAKPVERVSLARPGVLAKVLGNRELGRPQAIQHSRARRAALVSPAAICRLSSFEQNAPSIVPVEIESIAIQPIEISRLNIKKLSQER